MNVVKSALSESARTITGRALQGSLAHLVDLSLVAKHHRVGLSCRECGSGQQERLEEIARPGHVITRLVPGGEV